MNLQEILKKMTELREKLFKKFEEHTVKASDGSKTYNFTGDELTEVNAMNADLSKLGEEYDQAKALHDADTENEKRLKDLRKPVRPEFSGDPDGEPEGKGKKARVLTFGESVIGSKAFQSFKDGRRFDVAAEFDFDMKTLFQTSAGWDPYAERMDRVELTAERELVAAGLPAFGETTTDTLEYWEETTATMNAVEKNEAAAYPEDAFALTLRTENVRKIGTTIPATEEQLDDEARARTYLENRIRRSVLTRLDLQILVGDGTAPNISGYLDRAIQTQAKGADDHYSAVFKGITKVRFTGFAEPDAIVEHPNDWQDVVLLKDADGRFIWGNPQDNPQTRMWGKRVVREKRSSRTSRSS
ncbi:phage major capsid protein [Candidatus Parcubacteria bacterium]|nr:phage major capsid protein [Candidatus Parcubacteria bacterium]